MNVPSRISPSSKARPSFKIVVFPSLATCSMRTVVAAGSVIDFSLWKKSPAPIVDTCVFEALDQAPIGCGFARAYSLTASGARRSELPSRRTGFTALPLTFP